jgi:4-coumarate--CoA ligase
MRSKRLSHNPQTSPTTHICPTSQWQSKVGSIGTLLPNVQGRLVLDDGETDAADGEPGELWMKGPNIMKVQ